VLPRRTFGYLHPRFRTPVFNLVLSGIVGLLALKLSVATSTSFINFGAFTAFTMVNVSVISYFVRRRKAGRRLGVLGYVVVPVVGAVVNLWLLRNLDANAVRLGLAWLVIGIVYLAVLTRGFRTPPPELRLDDAEPAAKEELPV
jgi:putrescine importer